MRRVEGRDHGAPVGREHAPPLGEGARAVDQVDDEPGDDALEPAVSEGQLLGGRLPEADLGRRVAARLLEHLRRGIDRPDLRDPRQLGREASRAAADLEHPPPAQVALAHEQLVQLAPVRVHGTQRVVGGS